MRDGKMASQVLDARARIQLFGHEHSHEFGHTDQTLRICAGALHPYRGLGWAPHYNWVVVTIAGPPTSMAMQVQVCCRGWDEGRQKFGPVCPEGEDGPFCSNVFEVGRCVDAGSAGISVRGDESTAASDGSDDKGPRMVVDGRALDPSRILAQRYFSLDYVQQMCIADKLSLHDNDDVKLRGVELRIRHLERAKERGLLENLWDVVERLHGDGKYPENPYASRDRRGATDES